jgi:uncharacterized membrane-anchored protein
VNKTAKVTAFFWIMKICATMGGAALIGGLLGLLVFAATFTRLNRVLLFWMAFVLTRPFGATFGDLLTKPVAKGGLNFGTTGSSLFLASLLAIFVIYTNIMENRIVRQEVTEPDGQLETE